MRKVIPKRKVNRDAPPKVIYLVGLLAYAAWGAWTYLLFRRDPAEPENRLFFIAAFSLAIFFTALFLFYQVGKIISGKAAQVVFYPSARRAFFVSAFFLLTALMRLIGIFSWVNAGLLALILLLTEIWKSTR